MSHRRRDSISLGITLVVPVRIKIGWEKRRDQSEGKIGLIEREVLFRKLQKEEVVTRTNVSGQRNRT